MFGDDIASYLPEYIKPFATQLKHFPKDYEKWVHATSLPEKLYQGDVLSSAVIVTISEDGEPLTATVPAMIVSSTCDVQPDRSQSALIAIVYDFEDYKANHPLRDQALENHLASLMRNEIANLLYLPAGQDLAASIVDFQVISSIPLVLLYTDKFKKRLTSLSQVGHYFFLMKFAHHLTRPESADAQRT